MIKYQIQEEQLELLFHIEDQTGALVIECNGEVIKISHLVALELVEILRHKLYEQQEKSDSLIKRIFK
jgi:hypothetical protein